ncbi:hypothetical protein Dimus_031431 [Dionaea muscipula]
MAATFGFGGLGSHWRTFTVRDFWGGRHRRMSESRVGCELGSLSVSVRVPGCLLLGFFFFVGVLLWWEFAVSDLSCSLVLLLGVDGLQEFPTVYASVPVVFGCGFRWVFVLVPVTIQLLLGKTGIVTIADQMLSIWRTLG